MTRTNLHQGVAPVEDADGSRSVTRPETDDDIADSNTLVVCGQHSGDVTAKVILGAPMPGAALVPNSYKR